MTWLKEFMVTITESGTVGESFAEHKFIYARRAFLFGRVPCVKRLLHANQFLKNLNFLEPFFIVKRFQTSKNTLEALKTAGSARTRKPLKRLDLNFIRLRREN